VTDLAGLAVRTRQQPAADDQAAADPDVACRSSADLPDEPEVLCPLVMRARPSPGGG